MFGSKQRGTVIAKGLKIVGSVTAEGLVGEVVLKSHAHVVGDIHHQYLAIESGAFFDGHSVQVRRSGQEPEKLERKSVRQISKRESLSGRIERAEPVEAD